jgi:hypothetical protein
MRFTILFYEDLFREKSVIAGRKASLLGEKGRHGEKRASRINHDAHHYYDEGHMETTRSRKDGSDGDGKCSNFSGAVFVLVVLLFII